MRAGSGACAFSREVCYAVHITEVNCDRDADADVQRNDCDGVERAI